VVRQVLSFCLSIIVSSSLKFPFFICLFHFSKFMSACRILYHVTSLLCNNNFHCVIFIRFSLKFFMVECPFSQLKRLTWSIFIHVSDFMFIFSCQNVYPVKFCKFYQP
jgi:hypothetical protein